MTTHKILHDYHGNKSSKRVWGSTLLVLGIVTRLLLIATSLVKHIADIPPQAYSSAIYATDIFFYSGGGLLGFGVFEALASKKP